MLEHTEYEVTTTLELTEAKDLLVSKNIDLFILCHSLTQRESERALTMAHLVRPKMKNLILTAEISEPSIPEQDAVLTAFATPQALIAMVQSLTQQTTPSF